MAYEIVTDVLIRCPEKRVIFIDIINGYNAEKQALIFKKHFKERNIKEHHNRLLSRVKVIKVFCNLEFHDTMGKLGAIIKKISNTCLVVIDNLTFYYQDSYGFKVFGRGITRKDFVKHYVKIFHAVAVETGATVLFTLPEHLLRANNSNDVIKKSNKEEKAIYKHIQQKVDKKKSFSASDRNCPKKLPSNSPGHKSDSEINNIKPDTHDKLLDKTEIEAGMSLFLSKMGPNRFMLSIYKAGDSGNAEKSDNEIFYCIKKDGIEFREKADPQKNVNE